MGDVIRPSVNKISTEVSITRISIIIQVLGRYCDLSRQFLYALHPNKFIRCLHDHVSYTYISVMFSMSSNVRTGKSSIPGTGSTQTILEMLQVQDAGQASLNLHSPIRTKNNPRRAVPYSPALESIAGPVISHESPKQNLIKSNYCEDFLPPSSPLSCQVDPFDSAGKKKERKNKKTRTNRLSRRWGMRRVHGFNIKMPWTGLPVSAELVSHYCISMSWSKVSSGPSPGAAAAAAAVSLLRHRLLASAL